MQPSTQAVFPEPFPGARPYDEEHRDFFFGRGQEANEVTQRIFRERITILTGESASGKTSLVRAGVIPRLRYLRSLSEPDERSPLESQAAQPRVSPTLVLRDWGGGKGPSAEILIRSQLPEAICKLEAWSKRDSRLLRARYEGMTTVTDVGGVVAGLADAAGGLILVLDQFEEVLRARKSLARELIEILRRLYQSVPGVKLLLSLREEYHKDLRDLESVVGPLYARTYFLKQMDPPTVAEAIHLAAEAANVDLPQKIVGTLLSWLAEPEDVQEDAGLPAKVASTLGSDPPDLLRVQTVVRELVEFCESPDGEDRRVIDEGILERYLGNRSSKDVVGRALERWISDALNTPTPVREGSVPPQIAEPIQTGLAFRIAARLAPFLSSGGYKVAQEEADLFRSALREDLASLLGFENRDLLQQIAPAVRDSGDLFLSGLNFNPGITTRAEANLAGAASQWSVEDTLRQLFLTFRETLARLHERNVVKPLHIDDRAVWELVHDGFGKPFWTWAEENRETWDDCLSSLVACRGISPIRITASVDRHEAIQRLTWLGCLVRPVAKDIHLKGLLFENCNLRGTIFEDCTFVGATFRDCLMDGAVFRQCRFLPGEGSEGVLFKDCHANSLGLLACELSSLQFDDCTLRQPTFAGLTLMGPLRFTNSMLHLALFENLHSDGEGGFSFEGSSELHYCAWDGTFEALAGEKLQGFRHHGGRLDPFRSKAPA